MPAIAQSTEILTGPPADATSTLYTRNSYGLYYLSALGMIDNFEYYGMAQDLYQKGNDVFLKNPIGSFLVGETWIKGTKTSTGLEFQLPQPIYQQMNENTGKMETFYVDLFYYNPSTGEYERDDEVGRTYNLDLQPNGQYKFDYWNYFSQSTMFGTTYYTERCLGLVEGSTGDWMLYSELTCRLIPFDSTPVEAPADLTTKTYQFTYDNNGHLVNIGTKGNEIYIQGMLEAQPDRWLKGTVDGNKAKIPSKQYLGIADGQTIFISGAENIGTEYAPEPKGTDYLTLVYDEATDTWSPEELVWLCNSIEFDDTYALFLKSEIRPLPKVLSRTPMAPVIDSWMNYDKILEMGNVKVTISALNVNGDVLDPERLEYALYIDEDLYWMDPADYNYLNEEMAWIPYNYSDFWDILVYPRGLRTVYFYATVDKILEVQTRYKDDEGNYHYSRKGQVVTPGNENMLNGVATVENDINGVATYYDATGRRVNADHKGITFRVTRTNDGKVKTTKEMH